MPELEIEMERLRSPEIRARIEGGWTTVLFACGAVEQHGPHLPIFTDAEIGSHVALEVARWLGNTLVAPTIRVGCSDHHLAFAGTISLRKETFEAIVLDYVSSLAQHGFERILILPLHGGNFGPLAGMRDQLRKAAGSAAVKCYLDLNGLLELFNRETEAELGLGARVGGHADIAETSVMLTLHPELVRTDLAEAGFQAAWSDDFRERLFRDGIGSLSPIGILGDARGATESLGARLMDRLTSRVVDVFRAS